MANYCIMRIKKLHTNANVGGAISHHLRTRETDNADPERMKKNWFCPGVDFYENGKYDHEKNADLENRKKAQSRAMAIYKKILPEKIRKNAVRAVEFMMTVSPEVMSREGFNSVSYLNACQRWVRDKFGKENVFFIAQHLDETTPHVSLLLTPLDDKGKLNARKFFGGREKMSDLQDDFYESVGKEFGLERGIKGSKAKHQTIKSYYAKQNRKDQELKEIAEDISQNLPQKRFGQSAEEHLQETEKLIQERLKPVMKKTIEADQTEERLADLRKNFDGQVRQKILRKEKEFQDRLERKTTVKYPDGIEISCEKGILDALKERAEVAYQFKCLTPYGLRDLADRMEKMGINGQQAYEQAHAKGLDIADWLDTPVQERRKRNENTRVD